MNPAVREQLCQLVTTHGAATLEDHPQWLGLLRDLGVENRREVFALATAYQAHAPQELLNSPRAVPIATVVEQLTARLCADTGLADDAARWAIESWAIALELLDRGQGSGVRDQGTVDRQQSAVSSRVAAPSVVPDVPAATVPLVSAASEAPTTPAPTVATPATAAPTPPAAPTAPVELSASERRQIEQWLREAHMLRVRGQWNGAMEGVQRVLALDPNEAAALEMKGDLHAEHGDMDEALAAYQQAVGEGTPSSLLEEKIARALVLQEETERARLVEQFAYQPTASPVDQKRRRSIIMLVAMLVMFGLVILAGSLILGGLTNETNGRRRRRSQ